MIVVLLCQEIGKLHAARLLCRLTISIRANADSLATKNYSPAKSAPPPSCILYLTCLD